MTKKDEKLYTSRPGRTYKPRDGQPAKTKAPEKRTRPLLNDFGKAVSTGEEGLLYQERWYILERSPHLSSFAPNIYVISVNLVERG